MHVVRAHLARSWDPPGLCNLAAKLLLRESSMPNRATVTPPTKQF